MTETAEKLKVELTSLSSTERAELACFLIHSLDEESDSAVESAWDTELNQRMQDIRTGTAVGEPSHKIFVDLREKYS